MAWIKTKPADNSPLVSAEIRANWDALDAALMAPLTALANNQVLVKAAGPVLAGVPSGTDGWVLTLVAGVPTWTAPTAGASGPLVVPLPLEAARFPDGTAGNLYPQPVERISTGTPASGVPKLVELVYAFDATAIEWLIWKGRVPDGYTTGAVTLSARWSMLSATSGAIRVQAALGAIAPGGGDARALVTTAAVVSADQTVPGTLGGIAETRLTLTGLPTLTAGGKFLLALSLYTGAVSSAAGDRVLEAAALEFAR